MVPLIFRKKSRSVQKMQGRAPIGTTNEVLFLIYKMSLIGGVKKPEDGVGWLVGSTSQ